MTRKPEYITLQAVNIRFFLICDLLTGRFYEPHMLSKSLYFHNTSGICVPSNLINLTMFVNRIYRQLFFDCW